MAEEATGLVPSAVQAKVCAAVVDDDAFILDALTNMLELEGYAVESYRDGQAAFEAFKHSVPDIAIIDQIMPRMDGMELIKRIRELWDFPVIMVTGQADELDEAMGLRLGADDYVHKPFQSRLLLERIRANLRRANAASSHVEDAPTQSDIESVMVRGPLAINAECHTVFWRGTEVQLTVTEFQLLEALARRPGVVKTRDQLMDVAYSDQIYVDDRTIDSHIKRLRKKLRSADPEFSAIETLYGVGYRFSEPSPAV